MFQLEIMNANRKKQHLFYSASILIARLVISSGAITYNKYMKLKCFA